MIMLVRISALLKSLMPRQMNVPAQGVGKCFKWAARLRTVCAKFPTQDGQVSYVARDGIYYSR
ncbi:hypothetical protein [Streptomyces tubercidicus]|uniref:hypothetical protein n=1 Tax=Streptomyces tubercidicus TaxID=47759 RepID=UPI0036A0845D